jgi:hypothetical protein
MARPSIIISRVAARHVAFKSTLGDKRTARDRPMSNRSPIKTEKFCSQAVVIVGMLVTWTAAYAQEARGRIESAAGNDHSASTQGAAENSATPAEIDRLIADLGSDDFVLREAATKTLIKIGDDALEALKKALDSRDAEVVDRARRILRTIESQAASLTHRVVDSEGHPIAGAEVTVVACDPQTMEPTDTVLGRTTSDRRDRVSMRLDNARWINILALISHPRLGRAATSPGPPSQGLQPLAFLLVPNGTAAYARALKGQVLDENAKPVAGARVFCSTMPSKSACTSCTAARPDDKL